MKIQLLALVEECLGDEEAVAFGHPPRLLLLQKGLLYDSFIRRVTVICVVNREKVQRSAFSVQGLFSVQRSRIRVFRVQRSSLRVFRVWG